MELHHLTSLLQWGLLILILGLGILLINKLWRSNRLNERLEKMTKLSSNIYDYDEAMAESTEGEVKRNALQEKCVAILEKSNFFKYSENQALSLLLSKAGHYGKTKFYIFMVIQILTPFILMMLFLGLVISIFQRTDMWLMMGVGGIIGFALGVVMPKYILEKLATKYSQKISKTLPDVLEILIICLEAGYSNDQALQVIIDEFSNIAPEFANECKITLLELRLLPARQMAWQNLLKRVDVEMLKTVVASIEQNEKYGSSLLQYLESLLPQAKKERMFKAEEKAANIPTKLMFVMFIFVFPVVFVVIGAPLVLKYMG